MNRFLLVVSLSLPMTIGAPVWAANDSPAPIAPTTANSTQWSLEVLQPRVAAGGFPDDVHQSDFVIRALNSKGEPLMGVVVALPHIWKDEKELGAKDPDNPEMVMPRVEWPSGGKTLVTNSRGEARGRFTSGALVGQVVLRGPGGAQAKIEQVWNEEPEPFDESDGYFFGGNPKHLQYKFSLKRGDKMVPVAGHRLKLMLGNVTLTAWRRTGRLDEEGKPELEGDSFEWELEPPTEKASPEEKARWEIISSWFETQGFKETSPGVYEGTITPPVIDDDEHPRPVLDGVEIEDISAFSESAEDQDVYKDEDGGDQ